MKLPEKERRKADPEWDAFYRRDYAKVLDYRGWLRQSDELMAAADLLAPTVEQQWKQLEEFAAAGNTPLPPWDARPVHFMLAGYAIENLLKGALVVRSIPTNGVFTFPRMSPFAKKVSEGELPDALNSHDLYDLAKQVGITCTLEEEDLLRRLTRAVIWAGRYHVPKYYADLEGTAEFSDGKKGLISYQTGDDLERLKRLVKSLEDQLGRRRSKGTGA